MRNVVKRLLAAGVAAVALAGGVVIPQTGAQAISEYSGVCSNEYVGIVYVDWKFGRCYAGAGTLRSDNIHGGIGVWEADRMNAGNNSGQIMLYTKDVEGWYWWRQFCKGETLDFHALGVPRNTVVMLSID